MIDNFLILGCGYIGNFFLQKYPQSFHTHRNALHQKLDTQKIYFNLEDKDSWKSLLETTNVLWTFSAAQNEQEINLSLELYKKHFQKQKVIILSSTSAYISHIENENVNEDFPIQFTNPRFAAEEQLRKEGALILHLSGIIGPNRIPLNWYKKNLVKYGENILNYIHSEDILFFIEQLFHKFAPSERFNLTSGDYKTHNDILNILKTKDLIEEDYQFLFSEEKQGSKQVQNTKILSYIQNTNYKFKKYPEER